MSNMESGITVYDKAGHPRDLTGENVIVSDVTKATGSERVLNMIKVTQVQYDAIVTKDDLTIYVIVG